MNWSHKKLALAAAASGLLLVLACAPAATPPSSGPQAAGGDKPAWQLDWEKTVEAARKEKLVVVPHPGQFYQALIQSFEKAYPGISVEHTGARPSDISPRIITEQKNSVFAWDVMVATTSNMNNVLLPANAFQDIRPFFLLPDSIDEAKWEGGKFELYTSEKAPQVLIHNASVDTNIYVNRDKVSRQEFQGIDDLLNPSLRGRIVVDDCTVPAHGQSALIGLAQTKGEGFIRRILTEQQPTFQDTVRITTEWVATGRFGIGIGVDPPALVKLQSQGIGKSVEQIRWPGGNMSTQGAAVFRNAPHLNAAKVFLNWFWSREGQLAWLDAFAEQPPPVNSRRNDVPVKSPETRPDYSRFNQYVSWSMDSGAHLVKAVSDLCKQLRP